jgi:DNA-binding transcriptional LysR family regulator
LFLKTIETGNITRTAESFFVSQSAVSQQLKQLEEYFGKPLFYKDKTLKLTAFGNGIKSEIEQLVNYYTNKENHILSLTKQSEQTLNIIGKSAFILTIFKKFLEKNPIELHELQNSNNSSICESIQKGKSHIGFGEHESEYPNLESFEILHIPVILSIHKNHSLAAKEEIEVNDLKNETLILYSDQTYIGAKVQDLFIHNNFYPKDIIYSNHSKIIQMMTELNYGIGFIYSHTKETDNKSLVYKRIKGAAIQRPYSLIYNPMFITDYQKEIIAMLKDFFQKEDKRLNRIV